MAGTLTVTTINGVSTLNAPSGVLATQNGMTGVAKAWVQFTCPSGTVTIRGSFNISSVTRTATGVYLISFTTAMVDANYSATANAANANNNAASGWVQMFVNAGSDATPTTASFYIQGKTGGSGNANADLDYACVIVNGN
jgi:hypothetical protein